MNPSLGRKTVLIVTRELPLRDQLFGLVEGEGVLVNSSATLELGILSLAASREQLGVLFIEPEDEDFDALIAWGERAPELNLKGAPIVIVSDSPEASKLQEKFGAEGILRKPIHTPSLVKWVKMFLERPNTLTQQQQRYAVEWNAQVTRKHQGSQSPARSLSVLNISEGGVFLAWPNQNEPMPELHEELGLIIQQDQPSKAPLTVKASVRWVRKQNNGSLDPGIGAQFKDLTLDQMKTLQEWLSELRKHV